MGSACVGLCVCVSSDWTLKRFLFRAIRDNSRSNDLSGFFNPSVEEYMARRKKKRASVVKEKGKTKVANAKSAIEKNIGLSIVFQGRPNAFPKMNRKEKIPNIPVVVSNSRMKLVD